MSTEPVSLVHFANANSRPTYFAVHRVTQAHTMAKGKGVRVGILDHLFGCSKHPELYATGKDFVGGQESLESVDGHGYWMACVLREVAPEAEIVALNVYHPDPGRFVSALVDGIDWSIQNGIHVLTCSHAKSVCEAARQRKDDTVSRAIAHGLTTVFLHYDHPENILTYGIFPWNQREYSRHPDVNVWHYDYNTLFVNQYCTFMSRTEPPKSGNDIPYFSMSSTAAVTGGFVSLLRGIRPGLPPREYKELLIQTSYPWSYKGVASFEQGVAPRVVDISEAARRLTELGQGRDTANKQLEQT